MEQHEHPIITSVFLVFGLMMRIYGLTIEDVQAMSDIIVNAITFASLFVVIVINWPKFLNVIRRKNNGEEN